MKKNQSPKRALLEAYYGIRDLTRGMGISDHNYPRFHAPIPRQKEFPKYTPVEIRERIAEEMDFIRLLTSGAGHEIEILGRENKELSDMVERAIDVYGIPRNNLLKKSDKSP